MKRHKAGLTMFMPDAQSEWEPWPEWYCTVHESFIDSHMQCTGGQHAIPIHTGIPRFSASRYAAHFGAQWKRYRLTQLDSYTGLPISRTRLERCLGNVQIARKHVLECGCGAGRFTEILLDHGARVTSVDLSDAVEANAESFPISPLHRVAQADILQLPFAPQQYDVVLCLGVVQHTPSPERTIAALYDQVRPGGWLVLDHYAPPPTLRRYATTAPLLRLLAKRMKPRDTLRLTEWLTNRLLPLHKATADKWALRRIITHVSPLASVHKDYPELPEKLQYEWTMLDTHDILTDWYKNYRTVDQIRKILVNLGAADIWAANGGNGVEARCRRST